MAASAAGAVATASDDAPLIGGVNPLAVFRLLCADHQVMRPFFLAPKI
jgi:hypothetical protein